MNNDDDWACELACEKRVSQKSLKRMWKIIGKELKEMGYQVNNIQMPKVRAFILSLENFEETTKELSPHLMDTSSIEYGETDSDPPSACAFSIKSAMEDYWIILKCQGRNSLKKDLDHELKHIYESFLGLKWGTLTRG